MNDLSKIGASHLSRTAYIYLRQSSPTQVEHTTPIRLLPRRTRSADCRPRRALLHLSYSCAPPLLMPALVTHDPTRTLRVHRRRAPQRRSV